MALPALFARALHRSARPRAIERRLPAERADATPANTRMPTVLGRGAALRPDARGRGARALDARALPRARARVVPGRPGRSAHAAATPSPGRTGSARSARSCARGARRRCVGLVAWGLPARAAALGIPLVRGQGEPGDAGAHRRRPAHRRRHRRARPGRLARAARRSGASRGRHRRRALRRAGALALLDGRLVPRRLRVPRAHPHRARRVLVHRARAARRARGVAARQRGRRGAQGASRDAWRQARALEQRAQRQSSASRASRTSTPSPRDEAIVAALPARPRGRARRRARRRRADGSRRPRRRAVGSRRRRDAARRRRAPEPSSRPVRARGLPSEALPGSEPAPPRRDEAPALARSPLDPAAAPPAPRTTAEPKRRARRRRARKAPTIVDTSAALEKEQADARRGRARDGVGVPSCRASTSSSPTRSTRALADRPRQALREREHARRDARRLRRAAARSRRSCPGPTVTTFEVSPAAGTKVSQGRRPRRRSRARARAQGPHRRAHPGQEPHRLRAPQRAARAGRSCAISSRTGASRRSTRRCPCVLGRDILGNPVYADLASMPHVIVAGATGAGKSVGLNVMLTSLLYRRTPDELRLLMIDPKVVELAPFDRIPHMLLPVVTDMKQAANALKWAVDEMERRYQLFADAGTKNIGTYNALGRARRCAARRRTRRQGGHRQGSQRPARRRSRPSRRARRATAPLPEKLPFIVIVVDEFADLMMQQGKEVEAARGAPRAEGARRRHARHPRDAAAERRRHHRHDQGELPDAHRVPRRAEGRLAAPSSTSRAPSTCSARGDMLIKMNGTNETQARAVPVGQRGGGAARDRLPPHAGRAGLRREHPQAARRRRRGRRPRTTPSRTRCTTTRCASSPTRAAARRRGCSASSASATTAPHASSR